MSTLIHEQRDDRLVLRRLRRMQRLRRRRQRRKDEMVKRGLEILGWLTAVLIFLYASHAAFAQTTADAEAGGGQPAAEAPPVEPPRLTREEQAAEEAEARELVGRALERLRETGDVASLFDEMFVRDFAGHLRADARAYPFDDIVPPPVVAQASDEELRRIYAAVTNSLLAVTRRGALGRGLREASGTEQEGEGEMKAALEEVLRKELALAAADLGMKAGADSDDGDEFPAAAKTVAQMRALTSLFEKVTAAVREHSSSLEERLAAFGVSREQARGEAKIEDVTPDVFYGDRYGFAAGARNVRADAELFPDVKLRLTLVRDGERLRILAAEPVLDSE